MSAASTEDVAVGAEAVAAGSISLDLPGTDLVAHARGSASNALSNRATAYALAGTFLVASAATAAFAPALRGFSPISALVALAAFAIVSRVSFEVGNGWVFATQLVTIPMLFTLPARDVPLLVAAGYLLGEAPSFARRRVHVDQWPIYVSTRRIRSRLHSSCRSREPARRTGAMRPSTPEPSRRSSPPTSCRMGFGRASRGA